MKYEETARRLRQAMNDKGLRQQDLAELSGVSKSNISHYVNGNHVPDNVMAYKLARVLDVDPTWLMAPEEVPDYVVLPNGALVEAINKMSEKQLDRLLLYAEKILKEDLNDR